MLTHAHIQTDKKQIYTNFTSGFTAWENANIQQSKNTMHEKKNEDKKENIRTLMGTLTSTASILYITKHASFIRNLNHLANRS